MTRIKRRHLLRTAIVALPLLALLVAWVFTLSPTTINRTDPTIVATMFLTNVQTNMPNTAYQLTSKKFQTKIKLQDFTNDTVTPLSQQLTSAPPQIFSIAYPRDGKKEHFRAVYNVPGDEQRKDHQAIITLSRQGSDWYVDSLSTAVGKATAVPKGATKAPK